VKASKFVLTRPFDGFPKVDDIQLVEEELPELKDGEILCEAEWLSLDPYMRPYMSRFPLGTTMIGSQVAKVTASKNPEYPVGCHVLGYFGWRSHTITDAKSDQGDMMTKVTKLPERGLSRSMFLGVLGMPGVTAYLGLLELCKPKEGETVVVSTAAGAVGSIVGQIAKVKGCKVIGYTGSDEKVKWLKEIGYDHAFNYKKVDLDKSLKEAAPNGVDCYFDNVGGEFLTTVVNNMNRFGRVSICGHISEYNSQSGDTPTHNFSTMQILSKELRMEGFIVSRWIAKFPDTIHSLAKLVSEGKIKYKETVHNGFKHMPNAFFDLLNGKNEGKMLLKV